MALPAREGLPLASLRLVCETKGRSGDLPAGNATMDAAQRLLDLPRRITGIYEDPDFHREGQVTDVGRAALRKALKATLRDIETLDLAAGLKACGACRSAEEPGWWLW